MSFLRFVKMQGAGNDFILLDRSSGNFTVSPEQIRLLCDRKRGIGADGLIILSKLNFPEQKNIFRMDFYNCDGTTADMCGNGLRCAAAFACQHSMADGPEISFMTGAGLLRTRVLTDQQVRIELEINRDFTTVRADGYTVESGCVGVPHAVVFVKDIESFDVDHEGRMLRNHAAFQPSGTNVDFLPEDYDPAKPVRIRTYERGVEAETLACGTGSGAAACVLHGRHPGISSFQLQTQSGDILRLEFSPDEPKKIFLTGPAVETFHGSTGLIKQD